MLIKHRYLGTRKSAYGYISYTKETFMIRFLVALFTIALCSSHAHALHLTDRQLVVGGTIDVASAQKTSAKLLSMDAGAEAPIYPWFLRPVELPRV